jgi:glycosyltransferase involved in cell wall biosynthesis
VKIALLTDGIAPYVTGGMQRHSANLTKFLTLNGAKVTLFHCVLSNHDIPTEEEVNTAILGKDAIVKVNRIVTLSFPVSGKLPGQYIRNSYRYSEQLFTLIKDSVDQYDVIMVKGFCGWKLLEEKYKGWLCPPVLVNFHGYEMYQSPPNLKGKMIAFLLRNYVQPILNKADFVLSYGGKITTLLQDRAHVPKSKIISIPGGVDASWITPNKSLHQPLRFIFIGRYERRKGIEELGEVIQSLGENVQAQFTFVGPIPNDKQLTLNNVDYLGEIREADRIKKVLSEHDVLLCPSYAEGMPNVILEAMACGLAIIATDVGAVNTMVGSDNGWLLPAPTVDYIDNAIQYCIQHPEKVMRCKENSAIKIAQFKWDEIGKRTLENLKKVIEISRE